MSKLLLTALCVAGAILLCACDSDNSNNDPDAARDGSTDAGADADGVGDGDIDADLPPGELGDRCTVMEDCASGYCITQFRMRFATGGYCTERCEYTDPEACGDSGYCSRLDDERVCLKRCDDQSDCRDDHSCVGVCIPDTLVADQTPTDRVDDSDTLLPQIVADVDESRMRGHIEILSGETPWESPDGPVTITSRYWQHPDHEQAIGYLAEVFTDLGLDVELRPHGGWFEPGTNIFATLAGTDPELQPIYITAHYDSSGSLDERWEDPAVDPAPGASDNGSGVAIVLEIAAIFTELATTTPAERTVVFLLFDIEEMGLIGSGDFVANMTAEETPFCALNIDMVAWDAEILHGSYWYTFSPDYAGFGAFDMEVLGDFMPDVDPIYSDGAGTGFFDYSDQASFWDAGHCATYFSNWAERTLYHTLDDRIETYNWDAFMGVARSAAVVAGAWSYRWE